MPIYEYTCSKCGKRIEVIQKMSDKDLKTHAKCGGKLTKEISAAGFQFKGTGWYVTDYARKGKSDSQESKSEESKPAETATAEKKDTAAAKSEKSDKPAKASKSRKQ